VEEGPRVPSVKCSTSKFDDLVVVFVVGDVDMAGSSVLWDELAAQLVPESVVALDCTGVTFMDSMGLRTVVRAHQHAADQRGSFVLVGANKYVDQVLALTGTDGLFQHFADVEVARMALGSATE
jgi:anti-sigma B factor antagonist